MSQPSLFDASPPNPPEKLEQVLESFGIQKDLPGLSLRQLTPDDAQLALTKNYAMRADLLSRLLKFLDDKKRLEQPIKREQISAELAVPMERLEGAFGIVRKMELVTAKNTLTPFGELVLRSDPYLVDSMLLCLLHYLLASNPNLVVWSHLFNSVFTSRETVEPNDARDLFKDLSERWSEKTLTARAQQELGSTLRTYTDEMFRPLMLVSRLNVGTYIPTMNPVSLSPFAWLSILLVYRDRYYPGASSLEVNLIADGNYSPGRLLRQNENAVRRALDTLHNAGLVTVETRLGLDQVRFRREFTWLSAIQQHFITRE